MRVWVLGATGTNLDIWSLPRRARRKTVIHPAMVYHAGGGVFEQFRREARHQRQIEIRGSRRVRWPLIHRDDLARAYRLLLESDGASGHFNASARTGVPMGGLPDIWHI
ncbi:hypothetical protein KX928_02480 [Roseobacter sp. YSTF-M11]|uniref:NAD-dependent epimerase/dehydratase domain-containing protein n=1 Tax=Roseobacter insulae TaxID=2859783 RepID=A0A9X1FRW4_9RHOB|nr:NAD-dependent epimerase/dehydratase family protein [Roseobacter insulae]MBW4706644.1 hypothetical protein [Roseobacter insulae]